MPPHISLPAPRRTRPLTPGASLPRAALLVTVAALLAGCGDRHYVRPPETVRITVNGHTLEAELAIDPEQRRQGLMFRRDLPEDGGMLFVYPEPLPLSFWMKNTYIPLSIAFLADDGRILNIEDMQPFDETTRHRAARPCRYALEVRYGWFRAHGVVPGDRVEFRLPARAGAAGGS